MTDMERLLAAMAARGNAGGAAVLAPGPGGSATGPLQQPVAAVDTGDVYVGPWTVTLGRILNGVYPTPFSLQIRCKVRWGHDGAAFETELDWKRGTVFVVHGSYVQIFVATNGPLAGVAPAPWSIVCSAQITPGARAPAVAPAAGPTLTELGTGAIAALATTALIRVPGFAVSFSLYQGSSSVNAVGAALVFHVETTGAGILMFTQQQSSLSGSGQQQAVPTPIHPMAEFIRIQNIDVGLQEYVVVWQLGIG